MEFSRRQTTPHVAIAASALSLLSPALAVDLTVSSIVVTQSVQFGSTTLVGDRSTMVRASIGVAGTPSSVPDVDARLRVFVDGVELPDSPFWSVNGPILAPISPMLSTLDHTVNFIAVIPESPLVTFVVEVDPANRVAESNEANNSASFAGYVFACKGIVEIPYVAVDYTFNGAGLPDPALMEPGVGDAFVRAVFGPRELDYHRSPTPPLVWATDINSTDNQLLNALQDIRISQIPAAGYEVAPFIYGWLPGNPYWGNGKANGIPGDAAFGNTDPSRFQRTFAHEVGHLVGLSHNNASINTSGIDVEQHLALPLGLAQLFPSNKKDVMVAGQLTNAAFVNQGSFNKFDSDSRVQCPSTFGGGDGGGQGAPDGPPLFRISGTLRHLDRSVELEAFMDLDRAQPTADDPRGDLLVLVRDAAGAILWSVRQDTQRTRESCAGPRVAVPASHGAPIYVVGPRSLGDREATSVEVVDLFSGAVVASRTRSPNPPSVEILAAIAGPAPGAAGGGDPEPVAATVTVQWSASDPDGDELRHQLFYSPDEGASWLPLAVGLEATSFTFDADTVPAARGVAARFRVRTSDGFESTDSPEMLAALLDLGNPPDVHLLSPNPGSTHRQHASIVLHGSGWDLEDRMLPAESLEWFSSIDGPLGSGRIFTLATLTPGEHLITVVGTDSDGMSSSRSVTITVTPRPVLGPDLNLDGLVDGADLGLLLSAWGSPVHDLDGNGIVDGADLGILLSAWSDA